MKIKTLLLVCTVLLLSSCKYTVKETYTTPEISNKMVEGKKCTWSLLWLAPFNKDFANLDTIASTSGIEEVYSAEQRIYPYVLWTNYCMRVKGI